jgi:hypothetical protein
MKDSAQIKQYCKIAGALRPMIEQVGSHEKRVLEILPEYQGFLEQLFKDEQFAVLDELRFAHNRAEQADLRLDYYGSKTDAQTFGNITFPSTPPYSIDDLADKSPLEKFALISRVLRGISHKQDTDGLAYINDINAILPTYQQFINELKENMSELFGEFWWPQISGLNATYGVAWPEFMSLMIVGPHNTYINSKGQTLKGSVDWVLSGNDECKSVELLEPAKFYQHWNDINFQGHVSFKKGKKDNPKTVYSSIEDALTDPNEYNDCTHFVATKAILSGLPINGGKPFETPLALNNWFGDNSRVHVTQTPYNPIWDS